MPDLAHTWPFALTLYERLSSVLLRPIRTPTTASSRADARLELWRTQIQSPSLFAQRLASDHLSEEILLKLLGEDPEQEEFQQWVKRANQPRWVSSFLATFARVEPSLPFDGDDVIALTCTLLKPFIDQGRLQLRRSVESLRATYPDAYIDLDTLEYSLMSELITKLTDITSRSIVLELHIARLEERLIGNHSEERYRYFAEWCANPEHAQSLLAEYPVLARQIVETLERWLAASLECLTRLCADWEDVLSCLIGNAPGPLVALEFVGDPHRGGQTVQILKFASGECLVYKPRSLAAMKRFQDVLEWLNFWGQPYAFRPLRVLERQGYGWLEFIAHETCGDEVQVGRFYLRQGGLLALLYVFGVTDIHRENVIAAGEHPMLIDLEVLLRPLSSSTPEEMAFHHSVLAVGLLPYRTLVGENLLGVDVSGLGGMAGQTVTNDAPRWIDEGTDEVRLVNVALDLRVAQNHPISEEQDFCLAEVGHLIEEGFRATYSLLLAHRDEFAKTSGLFESFAQDEVRFLPRQTMTYEQLLADANHPDLLRDALDRDQLFDQLWDAVPMNPELEHLIRAERLDLQAGDIPYFVTRPGSHDLYSSRGECIPRFFSTSGLEMAHVRLKQLGSVDLERQCALIRMALGLKSNPTYQKALVAKVPHSTSLSERLLSAAISIGEHLGALAWGDNTWATWIGPVTPLQDDWVLGALGPDLYNGVSGIALFLAYLGECSGKEHHHELARLALEAQRCQLAGREARIDAIGAFTGWGGLVYVLAQLAHLWQDSSLLEEAQGFLERLDPLIEVDEDLDVLSGAAGCIAALLVLHEVSPSVRVLNLARRCGERVLARAQVQSVGVAWSTALSRRRSGVSIQSVLTDSGILPIAWGGFSHGASGFAWALMRLFVATNDERYRMTALKAIQYERSLFDPKRQNWIDLRSDCEDDQFYCAWCNGAPGIGLTRVQMLSKLDEFAYEEVAMAIEATCAHGFGAPRNHSLCHGDLGNIELLIQASTYFPQYRLMLKDIVEDILADALQNGWRCGALSFESPGLMVGLAGIGYELLRLSELFADEGTPSSLRVPSVLTLDPPTKSSPRRS